MLRLVPVLVVACGGADGSGRWDIDAAAVGGVGAFAVAVAAVVGSVGVEGAGGVYNHAETGFFAGPKARGIYNIMTP